MSKTGTKDLTRRREGAEEKRERREKEKTSKMRAFAPTRKIR